MPRRMVLTLLTLRLTLPQPKGGATAREPEKKEAQTQAEEEEKRCTNYKRGETNSDATQEENPRRVGLSREATRNGVMQTHKEAPNKNQND